MRKYCRLPVFAVLFLAAFVVSAAPASSGEKGAWPYGKPINLVVGYAAGGDSDVMTRMLAEYLTKDLGVDVIVTNIAGGNATVAMEEVISKKDPFTFLMINTASLSANPVTGLSDLTYKDMDCVSIYSKYSGEILYVSAKAPYSTLQEFVDHAKKNKTTMGVAAGGSLYAAGRAMIADAGLDLTLIDAGDGVERIVQVANGNLDATFASYANGREYIASGHVKELATLMQERAVGAPDLPCVREVIPSAIVNTLFVLLSAKGTNTEAELDAFADAIMNVYKSQPKYVEAIEKYSYQSAKPMTRAESIAELEKQYQHFQGYAPYLK